MMKFPWTMFIINDNKCKAFGEFVDFLTLVAIHKS